MSEDSWKQVALGEEACVYAYGVLAAQFPDGPDRNRAVDLAAAHARARDRARASLSDADPPVPAAFQIPFPVDSVAAARRLAALVEARLVDVYLRQIPDVEPEERKAFAAAGAEASARSVSWGGRPTAFPGGRDSEPLESPTASPTSATPAATAPTPATSAPSGAVTTPGSAEPSADGAAVG